MRINPILARKLQTLGIKVAGSDLDLGFGLELHSTSTAEGEKTGGGEGGGEEDGLASAISSKKCTVTSALHEQGDSLPTSGGLILRGTQLVAPETPETLTPPLVTDSIGLAQMELRAYSEEPTCQLSDSGSNSTAKGDGSG